MPFFSKARTLAEDSAPYQQVTRFQRTHVREAPIKDVAGPLDPNGTLTRMETRHERIAPAPQTVPTARITPSAFRSTPKANPAADLHDATPVPVSVLLRALPLRAACVPAKTDA